MLNYWLKLWSTNENLFNNAIKLVKNWFFDFIELYVIPWKFNKDVLEDFVKNNITISIHVPHWAHWFNPIDINNDCEEIWKDIRLYIELLRPFQVVMHPEIWSEVKVLEKRLNYFNDKRIIIENMPKKSSILPNIEFYWYSLEQIKEIKQINSWFCFDFAKAKSSALSQWLEIRNFSNNLLDITNPHYFHISGFLDNTEVDEHFDLWDWNSSLMKWMKDKLFDIWKQKDIYIVFECKKKDWVMNDMKNLEYFKTI